MKYFLLVIALAVGCGVYTHWSEWEPVAARARALVAKATPPATAPAESQAVIPGQTVPAATSAKTAGESSHLSPAMALAARVAEAQRQAVAKYPALSVVNSEMNSRFVFRYKHMILEQSARLQDANWPMLLADECAAASGLKPKTSTTAKSVATR